jgi:patatin-like phospholipase/acyl hydrolase
MKKLAISVSGGGALGIGPLAFMTRMEQDFGKKLCDMTFAYGGTSTGSIIAAGLAEGLQAHESFDLYKGNLKNIFKKYPWYKIFDTKCPTYDHTNLKKMLKSTFKGNVGDWKKPVYIPTTYMNGKSREKVWDLGDKSIEKWFAVLTSCSAPTYFDVIVRDGKSFCDGGMWGNDPIETLQAGLTKSGHKEYKILSFNTRMDTPHTACGNMSKLEWLEYILDEWVASTGMANYYEACANIGEENVFRASPSYGKKIKMDKTDDKTVNEVIDIWHSYYESVKGKLKEFINR